MTKQGSSEKSQQVIQGLQDFIFVSKYARWIPELKRRETWAEAVNRVRDMHLEKYSYLSNDDKQEIIDAFQMVHEKKVLPSMRAMQFGGKAALAHNARLFNCSVRHIDSIRSFAEVAYLMLCGCGTGIGLSKHFLSRMPNLVNESDKTGAVITYSVDDTIEGWADSLEALLSCYFQNTCFSGRKIIFDYSKIRRKGSLLKTGGGRAPGYKPLKAAHAKIKKLLDRIIEEDHTVRIRPIHAYDILMFFADAVLSGGVRRTASSVIFDEDDEEMINAKTCFDVQKVRSSYDEETNTQHCKVWVNKHIYDVVFDLNKSFDKYEYEEQVLKNKKIGWFHIQPQRGRSNNSVLLLRDKITKDTVTNIIELTKMWGEPGFVFANHEHTLFNPCFTKDTRILTDSGWKSFGDLLGQEVNIWQDNRVIGSIVDNNEEFNVNMGVVNNGVYNKATNIRLTGTNQKVYELELTCGRKVKATGNHHFATPYGMRTLDELTIDDEILIGLPPIYQSDRESLEWKTGFLAGFMIGDGNQDDETTNLDFWEDKYPKTDLLHLNRIVSDVINGYDKSIYHSSTKQPNLNPTFNLVDSAGSKCDKYRLGSAALRKLFKHLNITKNDDGQWIHQHDKNFKAGLIAGLFYTDGHIDYHGKSKSISLRITQSNLLLLENIQLICQELGSFSKIANLLPEKQTLLPNSKREPQLYTTKASYRLIIGSKIECSKALNWLYLFDKDKQIYNSISSVASSRVYPVKYTSKVRSIEYIGKQDVYCLQEDNRRTLIAEGMTARRCFEIGFIPVTEDGRCGVQFCNLTSLNGNLITCIEDFLKCVKAQTIIGTLQAGYTDFPYLSNAGKELTEEEALLGNSMTGVLSNINVLLDENVLQHGAKLGLEINEIWAKKIFINPAARIDAEKPEGTGSLAIGVQEPGAHAAHSPEFYRRTQTTKGDNVYEFFKKHNPHMCEESVWNSNKTDDVITWPIHAKEGAMVKADLTALQHLKIIKTIQQNWVIPGTSKYNKKDVTNSVSCTVIVKNEEWPEVIDYIFDNKEYFAAVSFLSDMGDKSYQQAPYEKITTLEEYANFYSLIDQYTPVDYTQLKESNDDTHHTAEASCAGGACLV